MPRLHARLALFGLLIASSPALAAPVLVPHPTVAAIGFARNGEGGELVARGGDGARLVAGGAAVITGAEGSKLTVGEGDVPRVALGGGGFALHVGSRAIVAEVCGAEIEARGAEILVLAAGDTCTVRVEQLFRGGSVAIRGPEPVPIPTRETRRIVAGGDPGTAQPETPREMERLLKKLTVAPAPPRIAPVDLEDPADLEKAAHGGELDQLEIETIEVEVDSDCVEICID
jgi:hypothetical protein